MSKQIRAVDSKASPDSIHIIDHSDAWNRINNCDKLILFCGSGISLFSPTNLPTGRALLDLCIESLEAQAKQLILPNYCFTELKSLPLEYLVGLLTERKSRKTVNDLITPIAEYFCDVVPNRIHYILASILLSHKQCYLITTNYDTGIEHALNEIQRCTTSSAYLRPVKVYGRKQMETEIEISCNSIFKIHGCAQLDSPTSLIITTKQESIGLPTHFQAILPKIFENSLVMFLGYSISEPDCMEALLETSNYSAIWVDIDTEKYSQNYRANTILDNAKESSLLIDLIPFIENPINLYPLDIFSHIALDLDTPELRIPFDQRQKGKVNQGLCLYQRLIFQEEAIHLLETTIQGYITLREFNRVNELLEVYSTFPKCSEYWRLTWEASIVRDKNSEWDKARQLYLQASKVEGITVIQEFSAKLEQYGLESLLEQNKCEQLVQIEQAISYLINRIKTELQVTKGEDTSDWLRVLGSAEKSLVQNLSYQQIRTIEALNQTLAICNDAVQHLYFGGDINKRIEAQRFLARIKYRIYITTKNKSYLDDALVISKKVMLLFSLMGISMGIINSKRQYALYLLQAKEYEKAEKVISELNDLVRNTVDKLSQIKVIGLEIILAYKMKNFILFGRSIVNFVKLCRYFTGSKSIMKNMYLAIRWYISLQQGTSG